MLFLDRRRSEFWRRAWRVIRQWSDSEYKVLDVCCGWGQFAPLFGYPEYQGIDFSENMLARAKSKYPKHAFLKADAKSFAPKDKVDIVFEVNSLHSMKLTPKEFYELYKEHARVAVACLEADEFTIFNLYHA